MKERERANKLELELNGIIDKNNEEIQKIEIQKVHVLCQINYTKYVYAFMFKRYTENRNSKISNANSANIG